MRRYCWRTGQAIDERECGPSGLCPECGVAWAGHREIAAGTCGAYVACTRADRDHQGHPCVLAPGHEGRCVTEGCDRG